MKPANDGTIPSGVMFRFTKPVTYTNGFVIDEDHVKQEAALGIPLPRVNIYNLGLEENDLVRVRQSMASPDADVEKWAGMIGTVKGWKHTVVVEFFDGTIKEFDREELSLREDKDGVQFHGLFTEATKEPS